MTCGCADRRPPLRARRLRIVVMLLILGLLAVAALQRWRKHLTEFPREIAEELGMVGPISVDPGFDLTNALVPPEQILSGGPPRDGIPSITSPEHVAADALDLADDARVIGISIGGEEVAYPLALLNWHECVNDAIGNIPIAVTYCPLCDSVAVFDRRSEASAESLWSQLQGRAITGPLAGTELETLPFELTRWAQWREAHPDGVVAAFPDPPRRAYDRNPYVDYLADPESLMFPVQPLSDRLGRKERILGLAASGEAVAVPLRDLAAGEHSIPIAGMSVPLEWNPEAQTLRVHDTPDGVKVMHTFWFAWGAMHPETSIFGDE